MLYLFNTNIIPSPAVVRVSLISRESAIDYVKYYPKSEIISAIGHEATARCMSELLGINVEVNRINANPVTGNVAISLKLNGRIEEGKVLTIEDMDNIGYSLFFIEFFDEDCEINKPHTA
jgi:hypothetical protein